MSTMATSLQWPPPYNDHLQWPPLTTAIQRSPLYTGHLSTTATSLRLPPVYNGHLSKMATSLQQPHLYTNHFSTMAHSITTTSLQQPLFSHSQQRPPLHNVFPSTTATPLTTATWSSLLQPCLYNGYLSTMATSRTATSLQWGPLHNATSLQFPNFRSPVTGTSPHRAPSYNVHPSTTATSLKRAPLYNGHSSATDTSKATHIFSFLFGVCFINVHVF